MAEDITRLLGLVGNGEQERMGAVFEALYPELRRLAGSRMRSTESTVTPTILVHELFLRISQGSTLSVAVEMRYLAGMEIAEIARMIACSERTVYREWERARAFLQVMLDDVDGENNGD